MKASEDENRLTTSFGEDYEQSVPSWLESELRERVSMCPDLCYWEIEIAFEIGVALAPYIGNLAELDVFDTILLSTSHEEGRLKEEMNLAVHRYAE